MGRIKQLLACSECGQPASQWVGRCASCGAWGSIGERSHPAGLGRALAAVATLETEGGVEDRVSTGSAGVDRVLGGGIVPGSVTLLAGEPGIGKSTLLLHVVARLSVAGHACLLASGEESRAQVAGRAKRLGIDGAEIAFVPGRDLGDVIESARARRPFLLAVDSIQTLRDADSPSAAGGPGQVRACADALVGMAKSEGIAVLLTGHVTKDGDVAGPRTLEHAVDTVLSFEGDPHSGLRRLAGGKNRFGAEGEVAWFEMAPDGLAEVGPPGLGSPAGAVPGAATALPLAGRRAYALEVQALAVKTDGPARRQATGLDVRRFSLIAAVLERAGGVAIGRAELFGATAGGVRLEDPGADLAIAAALASSSTQRPPPESSAFVGELSLTGAVRPVHGMPQRLAAAAASGVATVFAPSPVPAADGVRVVPVGHVGDALRWSRKG
ncbi:MAG: AAA family ATPase [Actinobacteria bacterium]|nr:AAA family ATPase [Actinomycetota bacterium]